MSGFEPRVRQATRFKKEYIMTYPRYNNGYIDNGNLVNLGRDKKPAKCPNCGGSNYRETVSMEKCTDCGLQFDYWGGRGNEAYNNYEANRRERERHEEEARIQRWKDDDCRGYLDEY